MASTTTSYEKNPTNDKNVPIENNDGTIENTADDCIDVDGSNLRNNVSVNNNNSDTNFNSCNKIPYEENSVTKSKKKKISKVQQNQIKSISKKDTCSFRIDKNDDTFVTLQQPEITTTRKLRNRQSTEILKTSTSNKSAKQVSVIKKRLRSHHTSAVSPTNSTVSSNTKKKSKVDTNNKIEIATNTLNKVLSAITNSPGIEVSVKESSHRNKDTEDISFTIELSKKQETESVTVLAKVFPEQGSCLVDKSIVSFLEEETNGEVNNFVNNIAAPNEMKGRNQSLIDILQNAEDSAVCTKNPEDLYRMDGEEIHVDENVEQLSVNNQLSYLCKLCQKIYERKDKCTVHVKTHLGIKQYICILCQSKFVCKSDVMKHIRCSHTNPRPISCPKCPKRFRSKFDLTEHMNVHKGVKPYQCADCDQSYHHKVSLQMHVKSHMPPQNLACEYCGKIFPYRTRLLSHVGSVHMKDKRNFRCRFCYNLYSSLTVLNDHIKTRHTTTYTCETCGKTFKVASKYKTHVLQHSNPKPYVCNICKNRYASKAFLNEHLLKHQGVRKHVCQKCGASFAQASHLAAHRHVHGEKNYACPECGKLFNRRDNMKVHRRRHIIFENKSNINQLHLDKEKKTISDEK